MHPGAVRPPTGPDRGDCVEVAACPDTVHVRDSKAPQGPQLTLAPAAWTRFLTYATHA
ncbi:hypothetical protein B1H18_24635 [Streptomyces tsukubensis]|uniref:DUF397 domain-containing protein n=1 Tax=Streptomyces tsukubensis TaxID=83656 RepID=A0A1V4A3Q6_9ACTN|nr:hypothetical protein B1H18_24635 [Streptomyces tsukubensis]